MSEINVIANPHNREVILGLMAVFGLYAEAWEKERFGAPKFSTFNPGRGGPDIKFGSGWTCVDPWNREQLHRMMTDAQTSIR